MKERATLFISYVVPAITFFYYSPFEFEVLYRRDEPTFDRDIKNLPHFPSPEGF